MIDGEHDAPAPDQRSEQPETEPREAHAVRGSSAPTQDEIPSALERAANLVTVLDSDVMFDPLRRYALLSLVVADAFATRWSNSLISEWAHVISRERRTTPEKAQLQRAKLLADFPEALVTPNTALQTLAASLVHDAGDQHVAACALAAAPCTLLTFNGRDFKRDELRTHGVFVRKPGPWLAERYQALTAEEQDEWCRALESHRLSLKDPAMTPTEYLDTMGARERGLRPLIELVRGALSDADAREAGTGHRHLNDESRRAEETRIPAG